MNPERWKQIEQIYNAALERSAEDRLDFLKQVCPEDDSLRNQVESLLAYENEATDFIESPAFLIAAGNLAKDPPVSFIGQQFNKYKIERLLGSGGMGEIYLAEDTQLGRRVALKMLAPHLIADRQSHLRFLREARLASSLDHPNICTIHEVSESQGQYFISMQYIEGQTLSEVIGSCPLTLSSLLSIALQVADALRTAHNSGIIHRDIKPGNILITEQGQAKVLDFGLAKLLLPDENSADPKLTQTGAVKGTPAYMSPEQARGEEVDSRSDIFSFGIVLYEMATGKQPFSKRSKAETMNAIINDPHPPVFTNNGEIPESLSAVIDTALAKSPDQRFKTMDELFAQLRETANETDSFRGLQVPDGVIIPFAQPSRRVMSYLPEFVQRRKKGLAVAATILILTAFGGIWGRYFREQTRAIDSVAVMPFVIDGENSDVDYLADGMCESLINSLSKLPKLSVKAFSSVFRYKEKNIPLPQIGAELNVQSVLTGRIVPRGDDLTLYLSLIDAQTGDQIWGEEYHRKFTDLVKLQKEIARDVSFKLKTKFSGVDEKRLAGNFTENPEAYRLYLRGRFYWNKRTPRDLEKSIDYFQQAVIADPKYALAFAGLADGYSMLASFGGMAPREAMPKAKAAALRAISLDEGLAESHVAVGYVAQYYEYDFEKAEREYKRTIELNPNYAVVHEFYGTLLSNLGRFDESATEFRIALELEPLSLGINRMYGENLRFARKYEESIAHLKRTLDLDDSFASAHRSLARVYLSTKDHAGHVEELARHFELIGEPQTAALMRDSFAKGGWKGFLSAMTGKDRPVRFFFPFYAAIYYAELGEKDRAFAELNKTFEERLYYNAWLKTDPNLDLLRDDPRFNELLLRIGFRE